MKIELKNVSKKFEDQFVLNNINISFDEGKIYGIIGRNGSGKSVLFNIICGFIKPTSGSVIIDGDDITTNNKFPTNIRALIESPKFIPNLSGYKNLELLASINNIINKDKIIDVLKLVELYNEKDKQYKKYSLGMKQKLGIACVLMENPDIIILDEPFNGLDSESVQNIRKILIEEKKNGKLILLATHICEDIDNLCDKILKLDNGIIIENK